MLPATAVQRLDPPPYILEERPDTPSFFLCLGADNRCATAFAGASSQALALVMMLDVTYCLRFF